MIKRIKLNTTQLHWKSLGSSHIKHVKYVTMTQKLQLAIKSVPVTLAVGVHAHRKDWE